MGYTAVCSGRVTLYYVMEVVYKVQRHWSGDLGSHGSNLPLKCFQFPLQCLHTGYALAEVIMRDATFLGLERPQKQSMLSYLLPGHWSHLHSAKYLLGISIELVDLISTH